MVLEEGKGKGGVIVGRARSKALGGSCVIVLGVRCSPFSLLYPLSFNLGFHIRCY